MIQVGNEKMKADLYTEITEQIIQLMEEGKCGNGIKWDKGNNGLPSNFETKQNYSGVNVLLLWDAIYKNGYSCSQWLTYKQANDMGGQVKKGSKGVRCIFFNHIEKESKENPQEIERIPFIKPFTVFNIEQIEGLVNEQQEKSFCDETAEHILKGSGANIIEIGTKAMYVPSKDTIFMPERHLFEDSKSFYAVAFHELTHWTGSKDRLNRDFSGRFGSESYAVEELVAELGASFLCSDMGFTSQTLPDHASYIENWVSVLKKDKRAIFTASSQASKAHTYIKQKIAEYEASQQIAA